MKERSLSGPLGASAALHLGVLALVAWTFRGQPPVPMPPVYRVNIVAAPPGPRAIGQVDPTPAPEDAPEAPTPPRTRETAPAEKTVAVKKATASKPTPRATPTTSTAKATSKTKAPRAGGGPVGDKGTDVATIKTDGLEFPYPGYLNNIVRQIALNFKPPSPNSPLRAEVAFIIRRDGTVAGFRFITRSGVYSFDLQAKGAVEKASASFGPLPEGFPDDALPVVFSFDPKFWR